MTHRDRVQEAAEELEDLGVEPTCEAIASHLRGALSFRQVTHARDILAGRGLWTFQARRTERPAGGPRPPEAVPKPARRRYLGPFAEDMKRLARLRKSQKSAATRPGGGA